MTDKTFKRIMVGVCSAALLAFVVYVAAMQSMSVPALSGPSGDGGDMNVIMLGP